MSKPLIYGNRIVDCGDSGVALVSNSDLHHDNQQLSSQFAQSEQEVRYKGKLPSCSNTGVIFLEGNYNKIDIISSQIKICCRAMG